MSLSTSDWVKTFINFVETGNISKTAEFLGLSQPAITHHLKQMEEHFPLPIFSFSGRKKVLTPYGQQIYKVFKNYEHQLNLKIDDVNRMFLDSKSATLRIGMRTEIARRLVDKLNFAGKIVIENSTGSKAIDLLEQRLLDVVITERTVTNDEVRVKKVFKDHTRLLVHKDILTNFADELTPDKIGKVVSSPDFMVNTPFLAYRSEPPFLNEWLAHGGINPKLIKQGLVCQDWYVIIKMINEKKGWSLIPSSISIINPDLIAYDIPTHIIPTSQFHAYYYDEFLAVPAFKDFLNQMTMSLENYGDS